MIEWLTGKPGSGKTLAAIEKGLEYKKEGRRVYYLGINGLDEKLTGFEKFPGEFHDWATILKPGDVLIVDEVQYFVGKGLSTRSVPDWLELLTRNRHFGVDMLMTTQDPMLVDSYLRRLVNKHSHYVNNFGKQESKVYTWPDGVEAPNDAAQKARADSRMWKYPVQIFPMYKSAELHTRKAYTPRMLKVFRWSLLVAAVALCFAAYAISKFWDSPKKSQSVQSSTATKASALDGLVGSRNSGKKTMTNAEWQERFIPRLKGVLWSEPAFDDRKVAAEPETYCIDVEEKKCRCLSEQGTDLDMPQAQCKDIALHGLYNPFRKPVRQQLASRQGEDVQREGDAAVYRLRDRYAQSEGAEPMRAEAGRHVSQEPPGSGRMENGRGETESGHFSK